MPKARKISSFTGSFFLSVNASSPWHFPHPFHDNDSLLPSNLKELHALFIPQILFFLSSIPKIAIREPDKIPVKSLISRVLDSFPTSFSCNISKEDLYTEL